MNWLSVFMQYARKVRMFNKSRYSRNRQNVRATFYFALYINIAVIYLVFSVVYNIAIFLSYNWWFYFIFVSFFFIPNYRRVYNNINWFI